VEARALLPVLVLLALALLPAAAHAAQPHWARYRLHSLPVLYDYDGDGAPELVAGGLVVDNYQVLRSPYPGAPVAVSDPLCDGRAYLLVQGSGRVYVYGNMTLVASIPGRVERVYGNGVVVSGGRVYWCGRLYNLNRTGVLVDNAEAPLLLSYVNGTLVLLDVGRGREWSIYPGLRPLAAYLRGGRLVVAAVNGDGRLVVVVWRPGEPPKLSPYNITPRRVLGYTWTGFYVETGGGVYHVGADEARLVTTWRVVGADRRYIYVYGGGRVAVISDASGAVVAEEPAPLGKPPLEAGDYPLLTLLYPGAAYVLYTGPPVSVTVYGPNVVFAGEPAEYTVVTEPKGLNYTLLVDGAPVANTTVNFTTPGWHTVTAVAGLGPVNASYTLRVYVYPRPLSISIKVEKPPTPNRYAEILVMTTDEGRRVKIPIVIRVWNVTVNATSWAPVRVPTPYKESPAVPVTITAADGLHRGRSRTFYLKWAALPVHVNVSYLGNSTYEIDVLGPSGEPVNGAVTVLLGGRPVYRGPAPARVKVPGPGFYRFVVRFQPESPGYAPGTFTVTLRFAAEQRTPKGATVIVVERNVTKTVTVTVTETPRARAAATRTVTVVKSSPTGSPVGYAVAGALSGAAAVTALYMLRGSGGDADEGEVEFE